MFILLYKVLGNEIIIALLINFCYQLDLRIPGILPSFASSLKQIRQRSKSLIYPRLLPQRKHLRTVRDENFGFLNAFAISDFFAINNTYLIQDAKY